MRSPIKLLIVTPDPDEPAAAVPRARRRRSRRGGFITRTDRNAALVRAAQMARKLAPEPPVPELDFSRGSRLPDRLYRLMGSGNNPSASRELALAAVQTWRAMSDRRSADPELADASDVTILFTDLVGFSSWALNAGDDNVIGLMSEVNRVSSEVIGAHQGRIVKSLGDGVMAVFVDASEAIHAAFELCTAIDAIEHDGYRPTLRTGLHTGNPRRVGNDYLGVDVNVAARVADAAGSGEVLATSDTLDSADPKRYLRRRRRFRAKGTPNNLEVFSVVPRYDDGTA